MNDLDELIDFLVDKRPQVKGMALDILLGLTGSPEGIAQLKTKLDKLLVFTLRLLGDADKEAARKALSTLINLSQDTEAAMKMQKSRTVSRCMDYLREGTCAHPRLMVMLLSNLTSHEEGCKDLLQLGHEKLEGLNIAFLLKKLVSSGILYAEGSEDTWEHCTLLLTNVTRLQRAREMLLQPGRGLLQALVAQLQAPSLLRRQGAAGAIRNCCMSAEEDGTLDHVLADGAVLRRMLHPVSGVDPKEADVSVREALADSIMVLASSKQGRKALWAVDGPQAVQKGYEYEEHPGVCQALEHAAEFFLLNQNENGEEGAEAEAADKAEADGAAQDEGAAAQQGEAQGAVNEKAG